MTSSCFQERHEQTDHAGKTAASDLQGPVTQRKPGIITSRPVCCHVFFLSSKAQHTPRVQHRVSDTWETLTLEQFLQNVHGLCAIGNIPLTAVSRAIHTNYNTLRDPNQESEIHALLKDFPSTVQKPNVTAVKEQQNLTASAFC